MKLETLVALSRESGRKVSDLLDRQDGVGEAVRDIARLNATETVRSTLSVGSSDLAAFAERIDLAALQPDPGTRLDEVTLAALREADAPDAVIEEAKAILGGQPVEREVPREAPRPRPQVIADVVGGDAVVAGAPGLSALAELGRGARAGLALGLGENSVQKLVDGGVVIGRDIPGGAAGLVERQILTEREARQFERVNTVARVIGSDPGVAEKIARAPDTTKLAARPERFWLDLADAREDKTLKPETWARFTRARIEALHPGIALAQRLAVQPQRIGSAVERLTSAQERVEAPLFTAPVLTPDMLEGLTAAQSRQVLAAHGEVRALEGRFPGLGIAATLQSGQGNPRQRLERVQRRVSAAQTFLQNNDGFLELDLTRGGPGRESLDFTGVPAADRDAVFGFAQSYQRIHAVAGSPELTAKAAEAGFHSALQIAATPISDMTVTGVLDMAEAELLHDRALEIAPGVVGMWGGVLDKHRDWFDRTPFANPPTGIEKALKDIPGFEDYFGSQDFCDCTHCRSILGPAAYFVDLMRFVEESVTSRAFTGSDADHPLALKVRRPDLWTLPLTCENTNTLIPTLQIVSEVIEAYMADQLGFAGDLSDRAAVARFVYRDTLPGVVDGFSQPFVLPVEEIEVFLDHHDMTLRDIALLMGLTGEDMVRMGLGLSAEELAQITTPETGLARLRTLYGHEFTQSGGRISPFEPKRIYSRTGFDRHDFGRAIETGFATRNGTDALEIRGAKRSAESVQNDMEQARNFTRVALDRIRRMALVTRALGWSFDAFDVAHSQLQAAGLAGADLTVATLGSLLRVDLLREMLDLSLEESIACLTLIPLRATEHEGTALMDRLFNGKPYDSSTPWPAGANTILLPAFGPVGTTASPEVLRLQAGLRLDDEGLTNLVRALAPALGIDPLAESAPGVPDLAARGFGASQENLSLLYRHVLIADALDIDMSELGALIALAPGVAGSELSDFAEIRAFARFKGQLEAAKRSIDDVLYITGGTPSDPALYPDPAVAASDMIAAVASAQSLTFSDTLFTTVDGINETTSAAIFAANPAAVTDVDGAFRLTAAYDPTAPLALPADDPATGIEVPAAIRADGAPLHAVLEPRHAPAVISAAASAALTAEPDVFAAAVAMLGTDLSSAAMIDALTGDGPPAPLETLLAEAGPLCLALNGSALTPERLDFIAAERAGLFAMADPRAISVATLLRIDGYALRARALDRSGNTTDFEALLRAHAPATAFTTGDPQALADLLDCDVSLATGLQAALVLPTDPFEALDVLEEGVETARQLGVGASAFTQMASEDYDTLAAGSEALQAGFRSRFETEEDWAEKVEPYRDRILSRRRDGLVAYLINSITGDFEKPDDIYYYFLIDPQMEGCGRTSRVVSANSTLQLYIQRIMLNLEETPPDHSRPKRVHPNLIDGEEWSWRKNYRVWEANRRVFLYPENYMLPELRDNKSQLFEAFEEKLASEDVNAESVRDAYIAYMRGFEQLSKLKITGAFHEKNTEEKRDVLHLFAVSAGEPKAHYYRRIEDFEYGITEEARSTNWGTWQEIDLKINSETLSPVMHQGRLHVFWTEVSSAPWTRLADSRQEFLGYKHRFRLYYTTRRIDGTWTEPQKIKLNRDPFHFGDGVVLDETFGGSVLYSDREHPEPIDDYTLSGFAWDRVLPEHMSASRSVLHIRGFDYRVNATVDFHEMALGDTLTSTLDDVRVPWIDPISALAALFLGAPIWFPSENILWSERVGSQRSLKKGPRPSWPYFTPYATGSLLLNKEVYEEMRRNRMGYNYMQNGWFPTEIDDRWKLDLTREIEKSFEGPELIRFDEGEPRLQVINGSPQHGLIDMDGALFALLDGLGEDGKYRLVRLNSSLTEDIARTLHNFGVDAMLDISAQEDLAEHALPFDIRSAEVDAAPAKVGEVDYGGAMGVYLEEIYLHMPLTIARVLNAQGDFAAAREWYQKVFDPMTSDEITDFPPGLTAAEIEHRKLDRVWRFRKFRGREVESLRDMLEDPAALDTYRNDPFNPHAIARLRTSTTQKYVLLAFVDNLLDEADALFATDLREQINEATLLYVLALDILGPRPNKLGDCGERIGEGLSFEEVEARVNSGNEMLLEIETMIINRGRRFVGAVAAEELRIREATARGLRVAGAEIRRDAERLVEGLALETRHEVEGFFHDGAIGERVGLDRGVSSDDLALAGALSPMMPMAAVGPYGASMDRTSHSAKMRRRGTGVGSVASVGEGGAFKGGTAGTGLAVSEKVRLVGQYAAREPLGIGGAGGRFTFVPSFGMSLIRSVDPVFCIPENDSLKGYWDRVEDRLFKIRNCMNIDGVRRPLALFAPRIDPMMLVRARAAGLAIDDILGAGAGELPPFRFRFLLERARSAVGMAKGMGEAMKSALIAKDAEELAQLRNAHSANILTLGRELKKLEIEMAEHGIEELAARKAMVEARKTYYTDLISKGDLSEESTEKNSKIAATVLKGIATGLELTAGIINLIPDAGPINPELGGGKKSAKVVKTIGTGFKLGADIATLVGVIAGNNAKKKRRYEGWNHAKSQAEYELATFPPREEAAATRLRIALDSLALQETQMEQQDEIIEFYEDKFTNMALYSHLASNLQRLYRQAFNIALTYARLAESAYRFETSEDSFVIGASHWDANRAGLLAADRLMLDLATLEQRWVEGSKRKMEVNQTFSLAQLDPAALMRLRETGGANFSIPEHAASLFYPGLYKMRIKAVRLTIPCVAGPYTNISATLALTESAIRGTTDLAVDPVTAPRARDAMIATSTAQSDAGVFDLNFKDERYLPFEGAGVISSWRLDLPKTFRPFSYDTISDVLVNISYTADYDAGLRTAMEDEAGALDAALVSVFAEVPQTRIISLRQDVSAAYQRLVSAPPGTAVDFDLTETMFPLFLRGKTLSVERTTMLIRTAEGISPAGVAFSLNGRAASAFAGDADFGDLPATTVANAFAGGLIGSQSLSVTNAADLAPDDGPSALSHDKIKDVLIAIDYTVAGAGA